jgi:hypothetical protein
MRREGINWLVVGSTVLALGSVFAMIFGHGQGRFSERSVVMYRRTIRYDSGIRGRVHYFGSIKDGWQAALERFNTEPDALYAGQEPARDMVKNLWNIPKTPPVDVPAVMDSATAAEILRCNALPRRAFGLSKLLGRWRGKGLAEFERTPQLLVGMGEQGASVGKDPLL